MVSVADTAKRVLRKEGRTQAWVIKRMNEVYPNLEMDRNKFSAIVLGKRKMSGDELIAFCKALEISPDEFTKEEVADAERDEIYKKV